MNCQELPIVMTENNITVFMNGKPLVVSKTSSNFENIKEGIKNNIPADELELLFDIKKHINKFSNGLIVIDENDNVFYDGQPLVNALSRRMVAMLNEGFDLTPLCNFMNKVAENPSRTAVVELYEFLEKNSLPITPSGNFLAYKRVQSNYKDFYSGTMDNSVGSVLRIKRNKVDDDRNRTCSYGLHFCSLEYLPSYYGGHGKVMIVEINPADVVSFPPDYNISKGRTCAYSVVGEYNNENEEAFDKSVVDASVWSDRFEENPDDADTWDDNYEDEENENCDDEYEEDSDDDNEGDDGNYDEASFNDPEQLSLFETNSSSNKESSSEPEQSVEDSFWGVESVVSKAEDSAGVSDDDKKEDCQKSNVIESSKYWW